MDLLKRCLHLTLYFLLLVSLKYLPKSMVHSSPTFTTYGDTVTTFQKLESNLAKSTGVSSLIYSKLSKKTNWHNRFAVVCRCLLHSFAPHRKTMDTM